MSDRVKLLVLVALLAVGAVVGLRGCRRVAGLRQADAVCDELGAGEWRRAVELGEAITGRDEPARRALECRCLALMQLGEKARALELLEEVRGRPETADWVPIAPLAAVLAEHWRDSGRLPEAADLAHHAARRYPEEFIFSFLELELRSRLENEDEVLADLRARLPQAGVAAPRLRLELAGRHNDRKEWADALELLGQEPPAEPMLRKRWYLLRAHTMAGTARVEDLIATFAGWQRSGGDPHELRAYYAYLVSTAALRDPRLKTEDLLRQVVDEIDRVPNRSLQEGVYYRYVATLVVAGEYEEALRHYERAVVRFGSLRGLTREEIERSSRQRSLLESPEPAASGALALRVDKPRPGDRLLLSASQGDPIDSPFDSLVVPASGLSKVSREVGIAPERWVLRDAAGATVGSGTAWVSPQSTLDVPVARRRGLAPARPFEARRPAADGRRRLFWIVLDCGDWRLLQYVRTRGELPVFDFLAEAGLSAVLRNDPPYTAVALKRLTTPAERGVTSFLGLLHQVGMEVAGLNFVGRNPFAPLGLLLPSQADLFTTLGARELVTVNMLRSFGPIGTGRQAEIVGPHGRVRLSSAYRGSRPLSAAEKDRFPLLGSAEETQDRPLIEEMAGDFDTAERFAAEEEVDLFVLRVASLDVLTHRHFAAVSRTGQDDGQGFLFDTYRYVDLRLGRLIEALDEDDVVIAMSDHGARTALEHDVRAILLAVGPSLPPGRFPGEPELRTVPRLVAELLGVETDWPSAGLEEANREMAGQV